jgi:ketosteroid isomerase-like protein
MLRPEDGADPLADLTLDSNVGPHAGLDAIYRRLVEGYRALDAATVASAYDEGALYLPHDVGIQRGREAVQGDFASYFAASRERNEQLLVSFRIVDRRVAGDLAYDVGIHTLRRLRNDRVLRTGRGKFALVALHAADGSWKIQVDSFSEL